METGTTITDLVPWITENADVLGVLCTDNTYKEKFLPLSVLLNGILRPDLSDNIDMTGIGLLNIRELTVTGLTDLIPYIQGDITQTETQTFNASHDFQFTTFNPFKNDLSEFINKGITIIKAAGQADNNMLSFQRAGYYKIMINIRRELSCNRSLSEFSLSNSNTYEWLNIKNYTYDSGANTVTENTRFSANETIVYDETNPNVNIRKTLREGEDIENVPYREIQFEFDVLITDPINERVFIDFQIINKDIPETAYQVGAELTATVNYIVSVNAWR